MEKLIFIRYKKSSSVLEGGEQGSQKNYNALCKLLGADNIDTIYIHDETKGHKFLDYLKGILYLPLGYYFGLTPNRVKDIVSRAKNYDFLYIDRSVFGIIARAAKLSGYKGRIIVFFHNVEKIYFSTKFSGKPWKLLISKCANHNDLLCCKYADRIISLNKRDSSLIKNLYGRDSDILIPVMFKDKYNRDSYPTETIKEKPCCMFLGSYCPNNNEGIEWFIKNVYPFVNISLTIIGKGMEKLQGKAWLSPEIELIPNALSLEPYFEKADIMILPIFKGSGMKVKTCESLMYGKNIIATDEAWEGYDLDYNQAGGKCNTSDEFILKINELVKLKKPKFNQYSRNIFLEKYSDSLASGLFAKVLYD